MLAICGHGFQYPHPLFMVTFFTVSSPKCQITADGQLILRTPQPDSDKDSDRYKDSDKDSGCDRDKDSDYDKVKDSDKDSDYNKGKGSDKQRKRQHVKLQQTDT